MPDNDPYLIPKNPADVVKTIAQRAQVPPDVADDYLKLTQVESGQNPNVRNSAKGAQGFGQVMPDVKGGTVRTVGGRKYDLTAPDQNIEAGLRYFNEGGSDPVGRRLYYFGGPRAKQHYERTGRIPNISDGNMTASQYVQATGGVQQARQDPYLIPKQPESDPYLVPKSSGQTPTATTKQNVSTPAVQTATTPAGQSRQPSVPIQRTQPKISSVVKDPDTGETLELPKEVPFKAGTVPEDDARLRGIPELERQKYIQKPAQSQVMSGDYTANLGNEGGNPESLSKAALRSLGVSDDLNTLYKQATGRNLLTVNNAQQDRAGNFKFRVPKQTVDFINAFQSGLGEGGVEEGLRRAAQVNQAGKQDIISSTAAAKQAASQDVAEAQAATKRGEENPFVRGVTGSAAKAAQQIGSVLPEGMSLANILSPSTGMMSSSAMKNLPLGLGEPLEMERKAQVMRAAAEQADIDKPLQGNLEQAEAGIGEAIPTAMMFAATQPLKAAQLPALGAAEGFTPEERIQGGLQGAATHATFGIPEQIAPNITGLAKRGLGAGTMMGVPVGEALARGESPVRALVGNAPYGVLGALSGGENEAAKREPLGIEKAPEFGVRGRPRSAAEDRAQRIEQQEADREAIRQQLGGVSETQAQPEAAQPLTEAEKNAQFSQLLAAQPALKEQAAQTAQPTQVARPKPEYPENIAAARERIGAMENPFADIAEPSEIDRGANVTVQPKTIAARTVEPNVQESAQPVARTPIAPEVGRSRPVAPPHATDNPNLNEIYTQPNIAGNVSEANAPRVAEVGTAPKTKLDLMLDTVESKKREVTFDVRDYTEEQKQRIIDAAEARGLHAASDGKRILVRDLRESGQPEAAPTTVDKIAGNERVALQATDVNQTPKTTEPVAPEVAKPETAEEARQKWQDTVKRVYEPTYGTTAEADTALEANRREVAAKEAADAEAAPKQRAAIITEWAKNNKPVKESGEWRLYDPADRNRYVELTPSELASARQPASTEVPVSEQPKSAGEKQPTDRYIISSRGGKWRITDSETKDSKGDYGDKDAAERIAKVLNASDAAVKSAEVAEPKSVAEKPALTKSQADAAATKAQQEWGRFGDVVDDLTAKKRAADKAVDEMKLDSANLKARQAKHRTTKSGLIEKYGVNNAKELEALFSSRQADAADAAKALDTAKAKLAELGQVKDAAFEAWRAVPKETIPAPSESETKPVEPVSEPVETKPERAVPRPPRAESASIAVRRKRMAENSLKTTSVKDFLTGDKGTKGEFDPQQLVDYLVVHGYDMYQAGKTKFEDWRDGMKKEYGERAEPHLRAAWDEVQKAIGVKEPEAATPDALTTRSPETTSIKNAAVEASREVRELPNLTPADHKGWEEAGERARAQGFDTPDKADAIADQVLKGTKKLLTDEESAGLRDRLRGIENQYDELATKAEGETDPEKLANLKFDGDVLREKHRLLTDATKKAGTDIARALAIRRSAVDKDLLLTQLGAERSYKLTTGEEPSAKAKEQIADLVKQNKELSEKLAKHEAKQKEASTDKFIREQQLKIRQQGRARTVEGLKAERADLKTQFAQAWAKTKPKSTTLSMGGLGDLDPKAIAELSQISVKLARNYIEDGITKSADLVDAVHSHLKDVADDLTKRDVSDLISGYGRTKNATTDPVERKLNELKSILAAQSGKADVLEQGIRPLRRGQQREKPTEDQRRALRELNEAMREKGPELAQRPQNVEREQATPLDKSKTTVRNRIEQLQKWISDGKREVEGRSRIIPDAELKQLQAERQGLERAAKLLDDPEADQKAVEKRLAEINKSISGLKSNIQSGRVESQFKEGQSSRWSPEIGAAERERAVLQRVAADMRTEAAKQARAVPKENASFYGANMSWADFEKEAKKALSQRKAFENRTQKQIAEYERKIREQDFSTKPPRETPVYDAEGNRMRAQLESLQRDFARLKEANKKTTVADALVRWKRFAVLTYGTTIGKLTSAASGRMVMTPAYEAAGQIGKHVPGLRSTFADEPSFRGFLKGEKKAVTQLWQGDSLRDVLSHLKGGEDLIGLLYGERGGDEFVKSSGGKTYIPRTVGEVLDRPGHYHAALKTVPKRAAFFRHFERALDAEIKKPNPRDIRDPEVQMAIAGEAKAYEEAQRAILQQPNWVSSLFNSAVEGLGRSDSRSARAFGKLLKFRYPITKVPVNYVGEAALHIAGLPSGLGEAAIRGVSAKLRPRMEASRREVIQNLAKRMPDAMADLEPAQRQRIARAIKVGGVGLGFMAWGMLRPDQFGGYYQPGKRDSKDVKFGGMRFMGINVPQWMGHIPPLEAAQFGATLRRVHDSMVKKGKEDQAKTEAVKEAVKGLVEEIPFNQDSLVDVMLGSEGKGRKLLGGEVRSMIPGAVQQVAKASDYPKGTSIGARLNPFGSAEPVKRKPETIGQEVKMGVPGMRQQVPIDDRVSRSEKLDPYIQQRRSKRLSDGEIDSLVAQDKITKADAKAIKEQGGMSAQQVDFSNAKPADAFSRFKKMTPIQQQEVRDIMERHAWSLTHSDSLTQAQKDANHKKLSDAGIKETPPARSSKSGSFSSPFKSSFKHLFDSSFR